MQENLIAIATSIGSSILAVGISWGITQAIIRRHSEEIRRLEEKAERFITTEYLNVIKEPIQEAIREMQADIKRILMIISRNNEVE